MNALGNYLSGVDTLSKSNNAYRFYPPSRNDFGACKEAIPTTSQLRLILLNLHLLCYCSIIVTKTGLEVQRGELLVPRHSLNAFSDSRHSWT